jgi:hypothetical protein
MKALQFKFESPTGCGAIQVGNPLCDKVTDHVRSSILRKASRLKVESQKNSGLCPFYVCHIKR